MPALRIYISAILLTLCSIAAHSEPVDKARKELFENKRNVLLLRKEKNLYLKELSLSQQQADNGMADPDLIAELKDSIAIADMLITNISELVSQQWLLLATLERGKPLTALDIALNKALNSNLPELIKNLSNNQAARKDVLRLKALLKQQARLSRPEQGDGKTITIATDQQVAEDEFLRLLALFNGRTSDESDDKVITVKGINNGVAFSQQDFLSYLGHDQYHMEAAVYQGAMNFLIDGRSWRLEVPAADHQATYVLIYDIRKEPIRLVMFNKSLLLE
ncbi:MAG: G3E family GTPase [Oceanicoccus sp.]|jgi:G3E family GTPase